MSLGELDNSGERDVLLWSLDERLRLAPTLLTQVTRAGEQPVFEVRLRSGRLVTATAGQQFRALDGWHQLAELTGDTRVAVPRLIPTPAATRRWPDAEVVMLAHLLGDGCVASNQPVHYTSADEANVIAVEEAAAHFGVTPRRVRQKNWWHVYLPAPYPLARGRRNPIAAWFDELGNLYGLRSYDKFVPDGVFGLPREQVAVFLRHLWATDGSVSWNPRFGQVRIYYASTSRYLVDDVARLLLRFGIQARIKRVTKAGYRDSYHLYIYGVEAQRIFLSEIGVHGVRGAKAEEALAQLEGVVANTNVDTVPREVWDQVRTGLAEQSISHRQFAKAMRIEFYGSTLWRHAPSRERLERAADILDDPSLRLLATSHVFWDQVAEVVEAEPQRVFHAVVRGSGNFLADGVILRDSCDYQ